MITIEDCEQAGSYEYKGLSTDIKPTDCTVNSLFLELDTGYFYYFDGNDWLKLKSGDGYNSFKKLIDRSITEITPEMTEGITRVYTHTFRGCSQLSKVTVSEGVTDIGQFAFYQCTALNDLNLPEGLSTIGNCAFEGCSSLTDLILKNGLKNIGDFSFKSCTGLSDITIPLGTETIGRWAFELCTSAINLSLPNTIVSIGEGAFKNCQNIRSITIPLDLKNIEKETFLGCSAAQSLLIQVFPVSPSQNKTNLKYIGDSAFRNCSSLKKISIPRGVETLDQYAFYECSSAETLSLPPTLTRLGDHCFARCSSLNTKVTIPSSLSGDRAWEGSSFSECTSLVTVHIEDGVSRIGDWNFFGCTSLQNINFPGSLGQQPPNPGNIGARAFKDCISLRSITIEYGVTLISDEAFIGCVGLSEVILPSSISHISKRAFYYSGMRSLKISAEWPPILDEDGIYRWDFNGYYLPKIFVPSGSESRYRSATRWSNFDILTLEN